MLERVAREVVRCCGGAALPLLTVPAVAAGMPSCPALLLPQPHTSPVTHTGQPVLGELNCAFVPVLVAATECSWPQAMAVTLQRRSPVSTRFGWCRDSPMELAPMPSCPQVLLPHASTEPCKTMAVDAL